MLGVRGRIVVAALSVCASTVAAQVEMDSGEVAREVDARLASEARLSWLTALALSRAPALRESGLRAEAVREQSAAAGRLPDPEFKYEQWGVPLSAPYALDRSDTLMFGLRQAFPAPGIRATRERAAKVESRVAELGRAATARELVRRVREAYFAYYAADAILAVHAEHQSLSEQIYEQTRASYDSGRASQQALLRSRVERSRLHADVLSGRERRDSSRYLLNTLSGRPIDAPLGAARVVMPRELPAVVASELREHIARERPEVAAADGAIERAELATEAAMKAAKRPSFMVGVDYWLMPMLESPHGYGLMAAMTLPWLNPDRFAAARGAAKAARADRAAREVAVQSAELELYQAVARFDAAKSAYELLERELLPEAQRSLEATRASFGLGQSDLLSVLEALRSYYQVRIEQAAARARLLDQLAAVEFAAGARLVDESAWEGEP